MKKDKTLKEAALGDGLHDQFTENLINDFNHVRGIAEEASNLTTDTSTDFMSLALIDEDNM